MICNKCGKDNKDEMKFCTQCGSKLNDEIKKIIVDNNSDNANNNEFIQKNDEYVNKISYQNNNKSGNNTGLIIIISIIAFVVIIGISALIILKVNSNKISSNNVSSNNSVKTNDNTTNNNNSNNFNDNVNINNENKDISSNNLVTDFDNYNIDVSMDMVVNEMSVNTKISGTVDVKNQIEYLKITMNMIGTSFTSEIYSDIKNGITYTSEPIKGGWTKTNEASEIYDLNEILSSIKSMENVSKIDDNHYIVKLTNADIINTLDSNDIDIADIPDELTADIYTNNGYIEKIKYNFNNVTEEFSEFNLEINISNYNKCENITIPQSVIESATEF